MIAIARLLIRLSAIFAAPSYRARWREEWLGELEAVRPRGVVAALRLAGGAPRDAIGTRRSTSDAPSGGAAAFRSDMVHAWRLLIRRPAHTAAIVACLAVGLIASTGTFSVLTSLMYGDQPGIRDRGSLARIYLSYDSATSVETIGGGERVAAEEPRLDDFAILRQLGPDSVLESLGAEAIQPMTVAARREPVSVIGAFASGGLFHTLRTTPSLGRLFSMDDERPGAPPVAVVTDAFWRTNYDANPDAIGSPILVAGQSFTLIGVTPVRFHGMRALGVGESDSQGTQIWIPMSYAATWPGRDADDELLLTTVGRRTAGHTNADVATQMSVAAARIAAAAPATRAHAKAVVRPHGFGPGDLPIAILLVIGGVLCLPLSVLAIGCANVANLQLSRAAERARELAVRLSLGATRGQLVRLLTVETLATSATAVGLSLAGLAVGLRMAQPYFPMELTVDWRVLVFAVVLTAGIAIGTGLLPAWLVLRRSAAGQLKQNAQGGGLGHSRMRSALIVTQVALSLVLLAIAGVFLRTIQTMNVEAPAALHEQIVARFNPLELRMTPVETRAFADTLAARASADQRVSGVAVSRSTAVRIGAVDQPPANDRLLQLVEITPSWMDVMDVKRLTGRALTSQDTGASVVVSARLAELLTPGGSPLGKALRLETGSGQPRRVEIVGVVADNPTRMTAAPTDPVIYSVLPAQLTSGFTLRVRSSAPDAIAANLRSIVTAADPRVTWLSLERGDRAYLSEGGEMMQAAAAIGACGLIALILSATGLYAVISYLVTLRRREIGIRLAIGADPHRIVALVMRQAMTLVGIGTAIGLILAVPSALLMQATFVARVRAIDPGAFLPTIGLLLVTGLIAAAIPARRAAAVDPVRALRQD